MISAEGIKRALGIEDRPAECPCCGEVHQGFIALLEGSGLLVECLNCGYWFTLREDREA